VVLLGAYARRSRAWERKGNQEEKVEETNLNFRKKARNKEGVKNAKANGRELERKGHEISNDKVKRGGVFAGLN